MHEKERGGEGGREGGREWMRVWVCIGCTKVCVRERVCECVGGCTQVCINLYTCNHFPFLYVYVGMSCMDAGRTDLTISTLS